MAVLLAAPVSAFAADKPPEVPADQSPALASPLAGEPLDHLSATRERPLFSPTRRPPPPPPPVVRNAEPPPPPPPPPNVALLGVVVDGDEVHAIVRTAPAAGMIRVRIGDDVGGWKVAQIEGRSLVLVLDGRAATFTMFAGNGVTGVPHGGTEEPPANQLPPQNQSPQNPPPPSTTAPPPHRRRGSLTGQKYSYGEMKTFSSSEGLYNAL
jgi:general secretion pathway protein N